MPTPGDRWHTRRRCAPEGRPAEVSADFTVSSAVSLTWSLRHRLPSNGLLLAVSALSCLSSSVLRTRTPTFGLWAAGSPQVTAGDSCGDGTASRPTAHPETRGSTKRGPCKPHAGPDSHPVIHLVSSRAAEGRADVLSLWDTSQGRDPGQVASDRSGTLPHESGVLNSSVWGTRCGESSGAGACGHSTCSKST